MLNQNSSSHVAMAAKNYGSSLTQNRFSLFPRSNGSTKGGCTHCGNPKHTTDNCFKKNGYPDWWDIFTERKSREGRDRRNKKECDKKDGGKATVMVSPSHSPSTLVSNAENCPTPVSTSPLPRESVGEELNWVTILLDSMVESMLPYIEQVKVDEPSDIGEESLEPIIGVSVTVELDISISPNTLGTPISPLAILAAITPPSMTTYPPMILLLLLRYI
ncbi:hypothetical protein Q3G72_025037 [Acer saccharum]|nr:hypothetical protein Q3G72_025037 [Acer saccharum]